MCCASVRVCFRPGESLAIAEVTVYIARAGAEIGSYERDELEALVRSGELRPTDHYWHEGMENWLLLQDLPADDTWEPLAAAAPEPIPERPRFPVAVVRGAIAAAVVIVIYFLVAAWNRSADDANPSSVTTGSPGPRTAASEIELRDKAAAELRAKIEKLPSRAAPPLNTFYYDVAVTMNHSYSTQIPWSALITGRENVVDPNSQETLSRLEFQMLADYRDGEWIFKEYRATTDDFAKTVTIETNEDATTQVPPSVVSLMGLKVYEDR